MSNTFIICQSTAYKCLKENFGHFSANYIKYHLNN